MAEAEIVEERPQDPPQGDPPVEPPVVPPATPDDDGGKPTGDDPQAVRARKEYQGRKRAESEREQARLENIRLSERLKTIEEERQKQTAKPQDRVFTIAEVNAAVDAGTISRADADRYIESEVIPATYKKLRAQEQQVEQQKAPIDRAIQDIGEYKKLFGWGAEPDRTSPDFIKVENKYRELIATGLPNNEVTERVAIEMVHGSLDALRKKREYAAANATARTFPVDGGAGGTGGGGNGRVDISKAPASMVAMWDREGTDAAARERQLKIYQDLQAAKRQR